MTPWIIGERPVFVFDSPNQAYRSTLIRLLDEPDFVTSPRGMETREILNYSFVVNSPSPDPIVTAFEERNKTIARYTAAEMELYISGARMVDDFAKAAAFWRDIANPDGTINSAYGYLIFVDATCGNAEFEQAWRTPWEWALYSLIQDQDSRQAYVRFSLPEHQWMGNKDQVCTMHGQFVIRENMLFLTIVMRSNDVVKGLVYDMPFFCYLMHRMVCELQSTYHDLKVGAYTHYAHSMHLYGRDKEVAERMCGR